MEAYKTLNMEEVVINSSNLKEIEAKLEDGRCYWASLNEGDGLEIIRFTSNKDAPAQCNDMNYCWYDLHQYWSIILTPIIPPKPFPSYEKIEKMALKKYPIKPSIFGASQSSDLWQDERQGFLECAKALIKLMKDGKE